MGSQGSGAAKILGDVHPIAYRALRRVQHVGEEGFLRWMRRSVDIRLEKAGIATGVR
jgi:hypothetical protein